MVGGVARSSTLSNKLTEGPQHGRCPINRFGTGSTLIFRGVDMGVSLLRVPTSVVF